ncbi:putative serine carboxypeptidase CPVL [Hypsibius exemplaris]|uniref:Carboxypeptidase n=1 Tax=Hypsibius exemplaris TaxID=2072580 RepID=A0A1W0X2X9_HYPEX|nr:putative serine carboxypeptidase CPVL [Hypsibius exemplaris]
MKSLMILVVAVCCLTLTTLCEAKQADRASSKRPWRPQHAFQSHTPQCDWDDGPLILTPYITSGQIELAQKLSSVDILSEYYRQSYSGFLTVNASDNSNMFFWFFPAEIDEPADAPLILWLQGGPGATSMFGLFVEHGPFHVTKHLRLVPREYRWTKLANMLYIDNPVGTGFSFTGSLDGYSRDEIQVGLNLYEGLLQFFTMFPQYQSTDFYITGESYGGKYVPALAYRIHVSNWNSTLQIPLKGIAIGNGLVDPGTMMQYGDLLFQLGLADENQRDYFHTQENLFRQAVSNSAWYEAFLIFDSLLNGDKIPWPTYFYNVTHSQYYFNILQDVQPADMEYYNQYLELCDVRSAIHVGKQEFSNGSLVEHFMLEDIAKSSALYLADLMNNYKVLLYNGQLDIICGLPLTEAYLQNLDWSGKDAYKNASRSVWKVDESDDQVAGYVRQVDKFYQVAVRLGGHMLPYDQPRSTFDMMWRFIFDKGFGPDTTKVHHARFLNRKI